jgi:hypothetical protein
MWDTAGLALKPFALTDPHGCPMFAPAYVGRKRWATRISYFTALARTTYAVSRKGNRMMLINATNLDRKPGKAPPQPFVPDPTICPLGTEAYPDFLLCCTRQDLWCGFP